MPPSPLQGWPGTPKSPSQGPSSFGRGITETPKPPQGQPHTAQGYNGDPYHHPRTPTMQPKPCSRDLQTPPGNPHAAQGYNRDTSPPPTPGTLHCGPGVQWGHHPLGTLPSVCGVQRRPLLPHPLQPVARPSAVARWRTVSSLTGHSGGSRVMASSPPSSASSAWIWGPEVQYSQRPPRYPSASPTPLSTMAAS